MSSISGVSAGAAVQSAQLAAQTQRIVEILKQVQEAEQVLLQTVVSSTSLGRNLDVSV